jgi:uncharacterized C2H2 Zn-finger protein
LSTNARYLSGYCLVVCLPPSPDYKSPLSTPNLFTNTLLTTIPFEPSRLRVDSNTNNMPALLTPIKAVKCTYPTCAASFDTEKAMKKHKKQAEEHDYCGRCDMDFESYDDYTRHKIYVPDVHGKACSACGEEFKSRSGLQRHFELVGCLSTSSDIQCTKQ